jgi:hypothetical protein
MKSPAKGPAVSDRKHALATRNAELIEAAVAIEIPESADKLDRELVDRSVAQIREIIAKTVSRGQDEVGRYLLKEFFDDDPAVYVASGPTKHASLTRLLERCESIELPVSKTFLVNALRLAVAAKELPRAATFNQLPPSHRVELLRVKAPEKLEKLAAKAVAGKLSVQKLRVLVQKSELRKLEAPGSGRRATPTVLKAIDVCLRQLRAEDTGKLLFHRGDVSTLTDEQLARAQAAFKILEKRVAELGRILG